MDISASGFVVPTAPYSYRPPSPPNINVPAQHLKNTEFSLKPSYYLVDSSQISSEEYAIITGNRAQTSVNRALSWKYEKRREAQPILDFLYLGPTSIIRDHGFLQREAISMVLVVRDARAPMNLASVNTAFTTLGISFAYIDIEPSRFVRSFYTMVRQVNSHLLAMHHTQAGRGEHNPICSNQLPNQAAIGRRGKVLVTCESGNDRSPPLVAAYIMFMFGQNMVAVLQFINVQRFCCGFDEESKRALLTWQEIIKASTTVASHSQNHTASAQFTTISNKANAKRGLDDMMEVAEEDKGDLGHDFVGDHDRFEGRGTFVPFMELD
ncbi:protein-tyrosine phosphatase-like protein [Trichoderma ceciliae]